MHIHLKMHTICSVSRRILHESRTYTSQDIYTMQSLDTSSRGFTCILLTFHRDIRKTSRDYASRDT